MWPRKRTWLTGLALGLALACASAGAAFAYWAVVGNPTPPPTMHSGTLDLTAGPVTGQEQLVGPGGTWSTSNWQLPMAVPGASAAAMVVLRAGPSTDLKVTAKISSGTGNLAPYLTATTTTGGAATNDVVGGVPRGTCSGNVQTDNVAISTTPTDILSNWDLATGATVNLCVVVTFSASAPASLQGATSGPLTLTLDTVQSTGGP